MKEFILDNSLTVKEQDFKILNQRYTFDIQEDAFKAVTELDATHRNYLDYLSLCWKNHYGIIISPTILWNMVLSNLAFEVNKKPETYRKYFTESDEKQEIIVEQSGYLIDVNLLIAGLQGRIPSSMLDYSFPEFTTDTNMSKIANYTAFLDMVSPYYIYSMLLCGIPKVKVLGEKADWLKFMMCLEVISATIPEFKEYLVGVSNKVAPITDKTCDYSNFFRLDECGSGSQLEVRGWIRDFFIENPLIPYPENFVSCISKIDYHNYNDGKDYRLYAGLFTSEVEDGYLVPAFGNQYFEKI
jgi:hypothetical protein